MNGIDYITDTNAIIYFLDGNPCMEDFTSVKFGFSIISEMELLSFQGLTPNEESEIKSLLNDCTKFHLTEDIKEKTIELRRKYKIKLPDSIIAATSIINNIPLISADKVFSQINELQFVLIVPEMK